MSWPFRFIHFGQHFRIRRSRLAGNHAAVLILMSFFAPCLPAAMSFATQPLVVLIRGFLATPAAVGPRHAALEPGAVRFASLVVVRLPTGLPVLASDEGCLALSNTVPVLSGAVHSVVATVVSNGRHGRWRWPEGLEP